MSAFRFIRRLALTAILPCCLIAIYAHAQTVPTHGEKQVGTTCAGLSHSTDFDTLVQCTTTAVGGTMQKSPLFIGAVTAPPYSATTCDSNKAGMLQYTASTMQYCNGSTWGILGTTASGLTGQSLYSGFPDYIACTNGSSQTLYLALNLKEPATIRYITLDSTPTYFIVSYTPAGAYSSNTNMTGFDCVTNAWSISQLISNGKAFNLVNGGGGVNTMVDGTAGAPGLYFSSDTNTGIYRPTTDTIGLATNGTEVVRVTATGSVGIGTSTVTHKLEVHDTTNYMLGLYEQNNVDGAAIRGYRALDSSGNPAAVTADSVLLGLRSFGYMSSGAYPSGTRASINLRAAESFTSSANGTYIDFNTTPTGSTTQAEVMRITASGSVGIGTTTPAATLHVSNTSGNVLIAGSQDATLGSRIISVHAGTKRT